MKVRVFQDSTLRVGVSNPDPSSNWETQLEDVCQEHGFVEENEFGSPRSAIHLARITRCSTLDIKKHILRYVNRQTPEALYEWIISMSMFNDTEWTNKGNTETCLHNATDVPAFVTQYKPGHWCFLEACV